MPTPEEIKKIAREYAEAMCPVGDYCGGVYDDVRNCDLSIYKDDAKSVLEWLSKGYCIVPKSNIQKLLGEYKTKRIEAALLGDDMTKYRHKIEVLITLFGKSLFNEEKE